MGSMGSLTATPFLPVLIVLILAARARQHSVCQLPACSCADSAGPVNSTEHPESFRVTCYVKSVSHQDPTLKKLTPDVTSVRLICSDWLNLSFLMPGTLSHLPDLERLGMENCRFAAVSRDAFRPVPNLRVLEIHHCVFTALPADVFSTTAKLSRLTLTHSTVDRMPHLCGQHNLEILNVSGQGLSQYAPAEECSPDTEFKKLVTVDISNNSLTELPHGFLDKAANLRELYIQDNRISNLSLSGCVKLELLNVLGQELQTASFTGNDCELDLKVLKLAGNGSELFPVHDLQRMPNLTVLHLENMAVDDSFWEVLPSLRNLTHLALPVNNVTSVRLVKEVSIQHLNLSANAITGVDKSTFSSHKDLTVIDLSCNNLTKLYSGVFVNLTSLLVLNLRHNQLQMLLQSAFQNLHSLQRLFLDNNRLGSLPYFLLREMRGLKTLAADHNRLVTLPRLKNAKELAEVSASYNQLTSVPGLEDVPSLQFVLLRGNRLRHVNSEVFLGAPSLLAVDLAENSISSLDHFKDHPSLLHLHLKDNFIRDVTFIFQRLPTLQTVFLDGNLMSRVTSEMFPPSLRFLGLSRNRVAYVERRVFLGLPSLVIVDLAPNYPALDRLPWESVQISPSHLPKPSFVVGPNRFVCDCELAYLKAWALTATTAPPSSPLLASLPDFIDLHLLRCRTHFSGEDVGFEDVPLWDFVCPLREAVCDASCPCCRPSPLGDPHLNCTCLLTCPHRCACFHGGSPHVHLYAHVFCQRRNFTEVPDLIPARATHVRLDGNRLTVLGRGAVSHLTAVMFLHLNGSGIESLQEGCFLGMDVLQVLDLSENNIGRIGEATFGRLPALEELDLQRNRIRFLHPGALSRLGALRVLHLHHNLLTRVDAVAALPSSAAVLTLAANPWSCDCEFVAAFVKFLTAYRASVRDYSTLSCVLEDVGLSSLAPSEESVVQGNVSTSEELPLPSGNRSVLISEFPFSSLCGNGSVTTTHALGHTSQAAVQALAGLAVVVVVSVVVGVVCVRCRREVQACVYSRLGVRVWDKAGRLDRQQAEDLKAHKANQGAAEDQNANAQPKIYDAFVSYSHHDEDFVVNTLVPRLEQQGPRQYRLCVHYRDFPVGDSIADTIADSVARSQRTILLLSRHFVQSDWCRFEFRTAHQHVLQHGGHRLILLLLGPLPDHALDADLKMAMKTRTYLTLKDPWFWEKLYFAMPDVPCHAHNTPQQPLTPLLPPHPWSPDPHDPGPHVPAVASDLRADRLLETLELAISRQESVSNGAPDSGEEPDLCPSPPTPGTPVRGRGESHQLGSDEDFDDSWSPTPAPDLPVPGRGESHQPGSDGDSDDSWSPTPAPDLPVPGRGESHQPGSDGHLDDAFTAVGVADTMAPNGAASAGSPDPHQRRDSDTGAGTDAQDVVVGVAAGNSDLQQSAGGETEVRSERHR